MKMSDGNLIPIVAGDLLSQPELVGPARGSYTGERILQDERRCMEIAIAVLQGQSKRAVAAQHSVARETIDVVMYEAARRGWIRPVLDRLQALAAGNAEQAGRVLAATLDKLEDRDLSHETRDALYKLSEVFRVQSDFARVGMGSPTSIHESKEVRVSASADDLRRLVEKVKSRSSDVESGGKLQFAGVSGALTAADTVMDTKPAGLVVETEVISDRAGQAGGMGGGGSAAAEGSKCGIGSGPSGQEAKSDA
mgnify:FL=1